MKKLHESVKNVLLNEDYEQDIDALVKKYHGIGYVHAAPSTADVNHPDSVTHWPFIVYEQQSYDAPHAYGFKTLADATAFMKECKKSFKPDHFAELSGVFKVSYIEVQH